MVSSGEKVGFFSSLSRSDVAINRKSRSSDSNWASHDVWVDWDMATAPKRRNKHPRPPPAQPTGRRGGAQPASGLLHGRGRWRRMVLRWAGQLMRRSAGSWGTSRPSASEDRTIT